MPEPVHVALVGLMGSGKTTVGRKLANRLGVAFVDADEALEARTGRSVRDWFEQSGEAAFRDAEAEVLDALLSSPDPAVVACGGGVVVTERCRDRLRKPDVTVVWLRADPSFLAGRAKRKEHRPLLDADVDATLARLHGERRSLYEEVADLVVDVEPHHRAGDKPKKRLAAVIEDLLVDGGSDAVRAEGVAR